MMLKKNEKISVNEKKNKSQKSRGIGLVLFTIALFGIAIGVSQKQIYDMQQVVKSLKTEINNDMKQLKKVYVYDLEETLRGIKLENLNREFEAKINILNDEVSAAQKKIASLKETKDKDDFSEMYLKSLKFKRDTMLQEYNNTIENLTEEINRVVTEVANEKGASVIFDKRAVATQINDVEDVTAEVIKRVKLVRPKILDE